MSVPPAVLEALRKLAVLAALSSDLVATARRSDLATIIGPEYDSAMIELRWVPRVTVLESNTRKSVRQKREEEISLHVEVLA